MVPLLLSGDTRPALREQARRLLDNLGDTDPVAAARTLATGRSALGHRAAIVGGDLVEVAAALAALAGDRPDAALVTGTAVEEGGLAFLFSGQGSQRAGMGRELYAAFPVFAAAWDEVVSLFPEPFDDDRIDETRFTQLGLFAFETALYRLVTSWGLRPDFLIGHSIGEIVAAHVSGIFPLADAVTLVEARGRLMQALPAGGAMVAVQARADEISAGVDIAAVNAPDAVVISGPEDVVLAEAARFDRSKRLTVSHAFHSVLMEPMLDEFRAVVEGLAFGQPSVPVASNLDGDLTTPGYWVRHVREAVRFHDGMRAVVDAGVTRFLEIGPEGVLVALAQQATEEIEDAVLVAASRRDRPETESLTTALAALHVTGVDVDWAALYANRGARTVTLPTYPFQRRRYWPARTVAAPVAGGSDGTPADGEFWAAVENADLDTLTSALRVDGDQPLREILPALAEWRRGRTAELLDELVRLGGVA